MKPLGSTTVFFEMGDWRNIRLVMQYDGSAYHGWQIQPQAVTIQEVLEDRIRQITRRESRVTASGRTDAGVHAIRQVVHFHTPSTLPVPAFQNGLNALLPPDIRILKVEEIDRDFHARYSADSKRYEYRIRNVPTPSVFHRRYEWWIKRPLDVPAMERAAGMFLGEHDFTSFCASGSDVNTFVRQITGCGWVTEGPLLIFRIEANGFLRHMVRNIVGTLVDVGLGKTKPEDIPGLIGAKDRTLAGMTAPAKGLFLVSVSYPPPWNLDNGDERGL